MALSLFAQSWVSMEKVKGSPITIKVVNSTIESSVLQFNLGGFNTAKNLDGSNNGSIISSPGTSPLLVAGAPDLGKIACSVIIPDLGAMKLEVLSSSFQDFNNIEIAPSKGNLTRNMDPSLIAFKKGEIYTQDAFWPSSIVNLNDPYILRDYRGEAIVFYPFQYNPIKKTLRVYSNILVKISTIVGSEGINQFIRSKPLLKIDPEFSAIYQSHFKNFNSVQYVPLVEQGDLLIICNSPWMSLMQPLVDWKIRKGIHTELVDINNAGGNNAASVQNYIYNYYQTHNLTYVLLVGDIAQVPSLNALGGVADPTYGFINGNDAYSEVFIGRFSAESPQDVTAQVDRTLNYEIFADTSQYSYGKAVVIGSDQGPGDDNEMDWEHAHNMRTDLLNFNYNQVAELYDGYQSITTDAPGDPVSSDLLSQLQLGAGVVTYTGHGSRTQLSTTGFSNADIPNLQAQNVLPFIWSVACINGDFGQPTGPCIAEALLRSKKYGANTGAVATFMSSINQTWNPPMDAQDEMIDILTRQDSTNIKRTFAGISFNGCFHMNDQYGLQGAEMTSTWHVFGDPTLEVRTAQPTNMVVSHTTSVFLGDSTITVNCNTDFANICLSFKGDILSNGMSMNGLSQLSFPPLTVVDTIFVTVTAFNKIPYLGYILVTPSNTPYVIYQTHFNKDYNGNKDGMPDYGEVISMDVSLKDLSLIDAINTSAQLTTNDTNVIILTNSFRFWGTITGNSVVKLDSAFTYLIKNDVPDQHVVEFLMYIKDNSGHSWISKINQIINAPVLEITSMNVNDSIGGNNNKKLESNESANLIFHCLNSGHSDAFVSNTLLSTTSSFLTLNTISKSTGSFAKQSGKDVSFNVTMGPNVAVGSPYNASLKFWAGAYDTLQTFIKSAGDIIEDFETGDFTKFNWVTSGPALWTVTNVQPYQGLFSSLSGNINDGERTDLEITLNVVANDSISFWYKVSSEPNWDFMRFYIDGTQFSEFSGSIPWSYTSFPIEPGIHLFTFSYQKDLVNSYGSDCAWLDNIRLPFNATIIGINNHTSENNLNIFPNPATSFFNVEVDLRKLSAAKITVLDIKGGIVAQKNFGSLKLGKQFLMMDCSKISNGMYFVKFESDQLIHTFKLNVLH